MSASYKHNKTIEEKREERKILKQKELAFYLCQDEYLYNNSTEAWNQMFFMVQDAITFAIKKKLKGVKRDDIDELALDATIQVMNRYKTNNTYKVTKLLSVAYWAALGILYNKKQQQLDKELSYEAWIEHEYGNEF